MKIEAVTVSVNFSDFLIKCVGNKNLFDRWVVVTEEWDKGAIKVCEDNGIEYVFTKRLHEPRAMFAKGRAINDGLAQLDRDDWILNIDSDILLPDNFRSVFKSMRPVENTMYWMNRTPRNKGTCVGYFQLWHSSATKVYPEKSIHACLDDRLHKEFFDGVDGRSIKRIRGINCIDVSGDIKFHGGRKRL